jgi:tetratricopeptide (TPR) repeat protein
MNNLDGALTEFETAARIAPMKAEIHYNIAGILSQQGRLDGAVKEYHETLRLDPQWQDAQNALDTLASKKP